MITMAATRILLRDAQPVPEGTRKPLGLVIHLDAIDIALRVER